MTRSVRLLPTATDIGGVNFSLTDSDWDEIEKIYKHSVPPAARAEILKATASFVWFEVFERAAQPLQPALDMVSSIDKAVWALYRALWPEMNPPGDTSATTYAIFSIKKHFSDRRLKIEKYDNWDHAFCGLLTSLSVACQRAKEEMSNPDAPAHREGECWNNWINRLTQIAKENELPHRVSKGSDKSDRASPFVLLVKALHTKVPAKARRHHHSLAALATAIVDARPKRREKNSREPAKKTPA